jgi:hypothetical protein
LIRNTKGNLRFKYFGGNMTKRILLTLLCILVSLYSISFITPDKKTTTVQIVFEFNKTVSTPDDSREKAVAFHSITCIDSLGKTISEFELGTSEANALQGSGWFENQTSLQVGTFQYAGGPDKSADMQIDIPDGTEGLLLTILSAEDSLWMTVMIDTDTAAVLLVDSFWHHGYVPIGDPIPEPESNDEPVWTDGRYFPQFPETESVYAITVRCPVGQSTDARDFDWRINSSQEVMSALTLVSMQGIINRNTPRLYLNWYDPSRPLPATSTSGFWIKELENHIDVVHLYLDGLSAIKFLLRRFSSRFSGSVVYDPRISDTINLATMIAGLEDRLILAPEQLGFPGIPDYSSVYDLRDLAVQQGWDETIESQTAIYQWVYDNLWQDLDKRIVGIASAGPGASREVEVGTEVYWPLEMASRDYMIANKLPVLYLDPFNSPQVDLLRQFLSEAPSPLPLTGVFAANEAKTLDRIAEYGGWEVGISWPGEILAVANLTILSSVRPQVIKFDREIDPAQILRTVWDKPVAGLFTTDGDATNYTMKRGYRGNFAWESVQDINFGWTINPILAELAPVVWNYFSTSRVEASLISAVSGAGYTITQKMDSTQLNKYLEYAKGYLSETGLRTIHQFDEFNDTFTDNMAQQFYDKLHDVGYLGTIYGYNVTVWAGLTFHYGNSPAPIIGTQYALTDHTKDYILKRILDRKKEAELIDFTSGSSFISTTDVWIVQDDSASGGEAVYVPTSFLSSPSYGMAINVGRMKFAPGDYTIQIKMKVADNTSAGYIANIQVARVEYAPEYNFIGLTSKDFRASDFTAADNYQIFEVPFSVNDIIKNAEIFISYGDGATDLYVDYVNIKSDRDVPLHTALVIDNINSYKGDPLLGTIQFIEEFQNEGGVIVSPDELVASLNPEYMIEFASSYLSPGDTLYQQAQSQLANGEYYESLISIRKALKTFNPETNIRYEVPKPSDITLIIYNILGQEIKTLVKQVKPAGSHTVKWDGTNNLGNRAASGMYVYRITAGKFSKSLKMVYLR